ncbi:type 1 glutamine amidotransferase domain-containing protein [Spiroplasma sp. BIUS-1]|uniref:type 1 glutamine amidotransferase domain-containing protein n=1 Tax=Spiroplasma sp. BIUS-1 TaxID=216964 RepID=UPI0013989334|nr:type 1 glutamine amidotransferase domain-containing protein [Spiroplasma sp. BIUS-1]QHX36949.1 hypothetical protein SBIUS_v1c06960 [Spiroplasma sp. BIUS-1]
MKKILLVLTNTSTYGEDSEKTGLWLGEATEFVLALRDQFEFDYVSPNGGVVPIDPRSLKYAKKNDIELMNDEEFKNKALTNSLKPSQVNAKDYFAIYYTGGHGVMWDFPNNTELQKIAIKIYQNNGYVASVCHGIAGLLNIKDEQDVYLINSKRVTGFTNTEEIISAKKKKVPFINKSEVKKRGGIFKSKRFFKPFALIDSRIITGQNPFSVIKVANLIKKEANKNHTV